MFIRLRENFLLENRNYLFKLKVYVDLDLNDEFMIYIIHANVTIV